MKILASYAKFVLYCFRKFIFCMHTLQRVVNKPSGWYYETTICTEEKPKGQS